MHEISASAQVSTLTSHVKPPNHISWLNSAMPTLPERLQEVMQARGWSRGDLVRITGMSSSVVSQWLGHGSKEIATIGDLAAAIAIERASGYSALWVARGIGERFPPKPSSGTRLAEPEPPPYLTPDRALGALSFTLANVAPELRRAVGDLLRGWAEDGGDPARIPAILAVLGLADRKRTDPT